MSARAGVPDLLLSRDDVGDRRLHDWSCVHRIIHFYVEIHDGYLVTVGWMLRRRWDRMGSVWLAAGPRSRT
jgi:hypothetical protein